MCWIHAHVRETWLDPESGRVIPEGWRVIIHKAAYRKNRRYLLRTTEPATFRGRAYRKACQHENSQPQGVHHRQPSGCGGRTLEDIAAADTDDYGGRLVTWAKQELARRGVGLPEQLAAAKAELEREAARGGTGCRGRLVTMRARVSRLEKEIARQEAIG